MRAHLWLLAVLLSAEAAAADSCAYPGSPLHGKLSEWAPGFVNNSFANFACSPGYILLGPESVQCSNGRWTRGVPLCVRDVARGKPVNQSEPVTTDFTSGLVVDGQDLTCTKRANNWTVSLFETSRISVVKLVFGEDLPRGGVTVRLGEEPEATDSEDGLCGQLDLTIRKNSPYFVVCDEGRARGRYLSVHVDPKNGAVPLCAIEAHTLSGLSPEDACPPGHNDAIKDAFNGNCLEFHIMDPASLSDARSICSKTDGRLVGADPIDDHTLSYLRWRTEALFSGRPFWLDVNDTEARRLFNEPASDLGSGDCYVLSSKNGPGRSECQSLNHVICAYSVVTCGRPRLPKGYHGWQIIDKLKTGRSLRNFRCSEGFYPDADEVVACDSRGRISGAARCREFKCGKQPSVKDGASWATSPDSVEYTCNGGKLIQGDPRVFCNSTTRLWSKAPICRTMLQAMKDWLQSTENKIEKNLDQKYRTFREFPTLERVAIIAGLVLLLTLIIFGIARRIHFVRQRNRFEGALRIANRRNPFDI